MKPSLVFVTLLTLAGVVTPPGIEASENVLVVVVASSGSMKQTPTIQAVQMASTVAALLGHDFHEAVPEAAPAANALLPTRGGSPTKDAAP